MYTNAEFTISMYHKLVVAIWPQANLVVVLRCSDKLTSFLMLHYYSLCWWYL
jgi:hypothetical protein